MINYLKNDFTWDKATLITKINVEISLIAETIKKIIELQKKEGDSDQAVEATIPIIELSEKQSKELSALISDLENHVLYKSLFVMTTSLVEYSIAEICKMIGPYFKDVEYDRFNSGTDKGLEKSKLYIKKYTSVNISNHKHWSKIIINTRVRNLILHNNSNIIVDYELSIENQKNYKEISNYFRVTESGYIFIQNIDYINYTLQINREFIYSVFNELMNEVEGPKVASAEHKKTE